jgi:hypothetical protein
MFCFFEISISDYFYSDLAILILLFSIISFVNSANNSYFAIPAFADTGDERLLRIC